MNVVPMRGYGQFRYAKDGSKVIFSIIAGEKSAKNPQTINVEIDFDLLMPFIGALQQIGADAEQARASSPLYSGATQGAYAFHYVSSGIGPSTKQDRHILKLDEQGPQGKSSHALSLDRAGIERLSALLQSYLGDLNSPDGSRKPGVH
ncbi:MAG: hypothetical protein IT530_02250 [Burkholderiales bacterium]|nr:hypothetical protein [Burkholderiales bacterium]